MKQKKHKNSFKTLKNKLWKLVSEYIRKRDKGICITCGRWAEGKGYHAGHYIPKAICGMVLRYSDRNIYGQCYNCNINLGGNGAKFHIELVKRYGQGFVDDLWKQKEILIKWEEEDYLRMIEYYKIKLKQL